MARLWIQHLPPCRIRINGEVRGWTNTVLRLEPGHYRIELDSENVEPPVLEMTIDPDADPNDIVAPRFRASTTTKLDRFASPLYCRYNGFMLGQFLLISYANYACEEYPVRRDRMQEFLDEIGIDLTVPEWHPNQTPAPDDFQEKLMLALHDTSSEIDSFVTLSVGLLEWSLAQGDKKREAMAREMIDGVVAQYKLPAPDMAGFTAREIDGNCISVNSVLDPTLAYLSEILAGIDEAGEQQTAFVAMPFSRPFNQYFPTFYRGALEAAGYRAIRAWGGLSNENYGALLNRVIEKSHLLWADVSKEREEGPNQGQRNLNVLYEIGVAHALKRRAIIVVDQADLEGLPANIGRDAIHAYDSADPKFPEKALEGAVNFVKTHAASAPWRPEPADLEAVVDVAVERLKHLIIPQEAYDAQKRGSELYAARDYEGAEREFSDAINLGNNATGVHMFRAGVRIRLEKYALAEEDLNEAIGRDDLDDLLRDETPGMRATAHFQRGFARQELGNEKGAQEDLEEASRLGFPVEETIE